MEISEITKEDSLYPVRLKQISNPPRKLYAIGNVKLLQREKAIAIVGSRECSQYGQMQTYRFAKELAKVGITVISGMALGIDSVAHLAAIHERGKTISVLGSGLNQIFPEENEYVFYQILKEGGCIISEYPPDEPKQSNYFPRRNRIVSGLASKVLVVEAAKRSGSLITAKIAKKQGKEVLTIPSDLERKQGEGTNELLLNGATMVTEPEQIISSMGEVEIEQENIEIPLPYQEVYRLLEKEERYMNEISRLLQMPLPEVTGILTMMELEGYIERTLQNQYRIRR